MTAPLDRFKDTLVLVDQSILQALKCIDNASLQIALVVDADMRLVGTVTDGDVRRGILAGVKLDEPVTRVMNKTPFTMPAATTRAEAIQVMTVRKYHHLPIVDSEGKLVRLEWLDALLQQEMQDAPAPFAAEDIAVVLMLGGQGTRLMPLTEKLPKPMLPVGDRPLLETIVRNFKEQGFRKFFFSVNYKAEVIEAHFGDGSAFGVDITYLHENTRMGTAGALTLLPEGPKGPLIVMNGDILTNNNFHQLINFHRQNKAHATMCVREYQQQVPYGIVQTVGTKLASIIEKPSHSYFVNAGIYVIGPEALSILPPGQYFDMPQFFEALGAQGYESAVFPIREYWLDVGRLDDLEQARIDYKKVFGY